MIKNYIWTAFRSLWRNKNISLINLFGLSTGITATVFVFIWVQNETSYDKYHTNSERIYRFTNAIQVNKEETWVWEDSPFPLANAAVKEVPGIEKATRLLVNVWQQPVISLNNQFITEPNSAFVDSNWFSMFDYTFLAGTAESFKQDPSGLVIGESKAKKFFGNADPIGKILKLDSTSYTVRAVVKDNPANSSFQFDVMMPLAAYMKNKNAAENANNWNNFNFLSFLKFNGSVIF